MRSLGLLASLDHIDCGHHIALDREGLPPLNPATGRGALVQRNQLKGNRRQLVVEQRAMFAAARAINAAG